MNQHITLQDLMAANYSTLRSQAAQSAMPSAPQIPPEVLFARTFVQDHHCLMRAIACHGDNCGFISPDALPGQDFAVGAAYDLLYGYFVAASRKLSYPELPIDPAEFDDDDDDEEDDLQDELGG